MKKKLIPISIVVILFIFILISNIYKEHDKYFKEHINEYSELYSLLSLYDFKEITKKDIYKMSFKDTTHVKKLNDYMKKLNVNKVQRLKEGMFFIISKSAIGDDGYFYNETHIDSLKYFEVLTPISGNWFHWYQD